MRLFPRKLHIRDHQVVGLPRNAAPQGMCACVGCVCVCVCVCVCAFGGECCASERDCIVKHHKRRADFEAIGRVTAHGQARVGYICHGYVSVDVQAKSVAMQCGASHSRVRAQKQSVGSIVLSF